MAKVNQAVEVEEEKNVIALSTGTKIRVKPVNGVLVQRAQSSIPLPDVYQQAVAGPNGTTRIVQNPNHADYVKKTSEVEAERSLKALEAILLYGCELVDKTVLADEDWLDILGMSVDLGRYYKTGEDGVPQIRGKIREMLYIMYVAAQTGEDYNKLARSASITEEAVQEEVGNFRNN